MAKFIVVAFAILSLNIAQAQQPEEVTPPRAIPNAAIPNVGIPNAAIFPNAMIPNAAMPVPAFAVPPLRAAPPPPVVNLGQVVVNVVIAKVLGIGDEAELSIAKFGGREADPAQRVVTTYQTETKMRTIVVNGENKEVTYTVQVPVSTVVNAKENLTPTEKDRSVPVSTVQAFDLKGSPLNTVEWTKRLANPQHVLLLREPINESNKLNPFYSSILREDMLLLFLKGVPIEAPAQQPGEVTPPRAIPNAAIPNAAIPNAAIPNAGLPNEAFRANAMLPIAAMPAAFPSPAAQVVPPVVNLGNVVVNVVIAKVLGSGAEAELTIAKFGGREAASAQRVLTTIQPETRIRTIVVNGENKEQAYTVHVAVSTVVNAKENFTPTEKDRSIPVSNVQAFDLKGSPLSTAEWTKRLANPHHVLLLREPINESNKLNPFYSAILREDLMLLFLKGEPIEAQKILRSYSVKDLPVWSKDGEDLDPSEFVNWVKSKVAPKAWSTNASIQPFEQQRALVVKADQATHEELAQFLRGLREEMAKQAKE